MPPDPALDARAEAIANDILNGLPDVTPGPWVAESSFDDTDLGVAVAASNDAAKISNPSRGVVAFANGLTDGAAVASPVARYIARCSPDRISDLIAAFKARGEEIKRLHERRFGGWILGDGSKANFDDPVIVSTSRGDYYAHLRGAVEIDDRTSPVVSYHVDGPNGGATQIHIVSWPQLRRKP